MMKAGGQIEIRCSAGDKGVEAFRPVLRNAMKAAGLLPHWKEKYVAGTTPSVLVNDKIVWIGSSADLGRLTNKDVGQLLHKGTSLRHSWLRVVRTHVSFITAVVVAFFPKCPFCWAAYMSLLTSMGIDALPYKPWLLPVFIALLFLNIVSLYLSRKRHGYRPMLLALTGALVITVNRLLWQQTILMVCGAVLLIVASLWNTLPRRMALSVKYYFLPRGKQMHS